MNERIRELAEQANEYATTRHPVTSSPWSFNSEKFVKKFTELIVQECIKEIEFQYGGGSDQPMDSEWDRAIECVSSMVKYRFGVEE